MRQQRRNSDPAASLRIPLLTEAHKRALWVVSILSSCSGPIVAVEVCSGNPLSVTINKSKIHAFVMAMEVGVVLVIVETSGTRASKGRSRYWEVADKVAFNKEGGFCRIFRELCAGAFRPGIGAICHVVRTQRGIAAGRWEAREHNRETEPIPVVVRNPADPHDQVRMYSLWCMKRCSWTYWDTGTHRCF